MKVTVFAIVLCFAAFVSAAPLDEARGPISDKIHALVAQLNTMLSNSNANPALIAAIQSAISHLHNLHAVQTRGVFDSFANMFGLGEIWSTISAMPAGIFAQVTGVMQQLLFVGKDKWENEIKPILMKLKDQVLAHLTDGTAVTLVQNAFNEIQGHISGIIGKREINPAFERGFTDTLMNVFGLHSVINTITTMGGNFKQQFFLILEKFLFAGSSAFNAAKPIFSELVSNLQAHAENAVPLLSNAMAQLSGILSSHVGKRETERAFFDTVISMFGIKEIWNSIQTMGTNFVDQFKQVMTSLLFAGSSAWAGAKPILSELIANVHAHIGNAGPLVSQAMTQLQAVIMHHVTGKRDLAAQRGPVDFIANLLGINFNGIIDMVSNLHSELSDKFFTLVEKLFFMGSAAWPKLKEVLKNFVSGMTGHLGDLIPHLQTTVGELTNVFNSLVSQVGKRDLALERGFISDMLANLNFGGLNLGSISSLIANLHSQLSEKFTVLLAQIVGMGQNVVAEAVPALKDFIAKVIANPKDISNLLKDIVAKLTAIVQSHIGKRELAAQRGFLDMIGATSILNAVSSYGKDLYEQLKAALGNLQTAGLAAWAAAIPVMTGLAGNLLSHVGNGKPFIEQAIAQIQAIVSGHISNLVIGKRAAISDFVMNTLGLGQIATLAQTVGANLKDQLMAVIEKLIFSGKDVLAQAKDIIFKTMAAIQAHVGDAVPLVQQAIASLTALLPK